MSHASADVDIDEEELKYRRPPKRKVNQYDRHVGSVIDALSSAMDASLAMKSDAIRAKCRKQSDQFISYCHAGRFI